MSRKILFDPRYTRMAVRRIFFSSTLFIKAHPRSLFLVMMINLFAGFTVMLLPHDSPRQKAGKSNLGASGAAFFKSGPLESFLMFAQVLQLQRQLQDTYSKDHLTTLDSILIARAAGKLDSIYLQLNKP